MAASHGSHRHCGDLVPTPAPGQHVHHIYVADSECPEETYVYREPASDGGKVRSDNIIFVDGIPIRARGHRGVSPASLNLNESSDDEEEIRVRERRDTIVTVGKKKNNAKGAKKTSRH